ncbi:MAG TPA: colanic acid biosynthesis glycosyltransferase WcaL [bacterium]|nr:colanic acid biosynthesis glycosyltransferase WcaL [bacterium]
MSASEVVWQGHPHAPAPLGAIRAARRRGPARVVDDSGRELTFGRWQWLRELARTAWQRLLHLDLTAAAALLTSRKPPPFPPPRPSGDGPVVVVLPVLPDLSHTFVYRELLAMLERRPDWRVVVLQHNRRAPVHREAGRLRDRVTFLPRDGVTRHYLRALGWLLGHRRARQLVALYRSQPDADSRELFGKPTLRDPRHPGNAFLLADLLRALRPRHLHVYASTWPANVAMGTAHLLDVPFSISSYVDFEFPYSHRMLAEKVRRATFFRVVTRYCAERLRALVPEITAERAPVVYLGLDLDNWQQRAEPPGQGIIVSAARIVPKKGLHLMPAALEVLRQRGLQFRWRVLGDGPELERVRALCREHRVDDAVELLGACDNSAVRAALLRADVAALPCLVADDGERDGIPIFFVEAMALGVPVVTTPISGIPELVRDGDTGFLHAPDDVAALADRLAAVFADPARARAVGERGRAEVHRTLDVHRSAAQLIGHIEKAPGCDE